MSTRYLFTDSPQSVQSKRLVNIYADEIQPCVHQLTKQKWMYIGAVFEDVGSDLLDRLLNARYAKHMSGWESRVEQNDTKLHWNELKDVANKKFLAQRWLDFMLNDCGPEYRNLRFSILGINVSNLNLAEFGTEQQFSTIYNRFFRSLVFHAMSMFYGREVTVNQIYHEEGIQEQHKYFTWHTKYRLAQDLGIASINPEIEYLPKDHKKNNLSNYIQLIDMLLGMYKDLHLGVNHETYPAAKAELLEHSFISDVIEARVLRSPNNPNSSYGHHDRFNISLYARNKTDPDDIERKQDNFYDITKESLAYYDSTQPTLGLLG